MNVQTMDLDQIREAVKTSHEKYINAIVKFANNEISKEDFEREEKNFKQTKKEILSLKADLSNEHYDPAYSFAYELDIENNKIFEDELNSLSSLKKDGEDKVRLLKENIRTIKFRKNIKSAEKKELIEPLLKELEAAKVVENENKEDIKALSKKLRFIIKKLGRISFYYSKVTNKHNKLLAKQTFDNNLAQEKENYLSKSKSCSNKKEQRILRAEHNSKVSEFKREYNEAKTSSHDEIGKSFMKTYSMMKKINSRQKLEDRINIKLFDIVHNFKLGTFLRRYSLYFVILIFFIICAIIAQCQGNPLLTFRTVETICIQSSTKVFFSLGVAGLILLGGTDLSIGRMTGMAASFSCLFLSQLVYETNIGTISTVMPQAVAIFVGLLVCVFSTTLLVKLSHLLHIVDEISFD